MQVLEYSHRSGKSTIGVRHCRQLRDAVEGVSFTVHRNCAREVRSAVLEELYNLGWSDQVQLDASRKITITAMLGRIGLCLQTGNVSRFPYDLLKLQALFLDDRINSAFYILPTKACATIMGSNIANFERLTAELQNIFSKVITMPIVVLGFENEG
jgi:hypothetical protein